MNAIPWNFFHLKREDFMVMIRLGYIEIGEEFFVPHGIPIYLQQSAMCQGLTNETRSSKLNDFV